MLYLHFGAHPPHMGTPPSCPYPSSSPHPGHVPMGVGRGLVWSPVVAPQGDAEPPEHPLPRWSGTPKSPVVHERGVRGGASTIVPTLGRWHLLGHPSWQDWCQHLPVGSPLDPCPRPGVGTDPPGSPAGHGGSGGVKVMDGVTRRGPPHRPALAGRGGWVTPVPLALARGEDAVGGACVSSGGSGGAPAVPHPRPSPPGGGQRWVLPPPQPSQVGHGHPRARGPPERAHRQLGAHRHAATPPGQGSPALSLPAPPVAPTTLLLSRTNTPLLGATKPQPPGCHRGHGLSLFGGLRTAGTPVLPTPPQGRGGSGTLGAVPS